MQQMANFVEHILFSFSTIKSANISYWTTDFVYVTVYVTIVTVYKWDIIFILVIYFVSYSTIVIFVH